MVNIFTIEYYATVGGKERWRAGGRGALKTNVEWIPKYTVKWKKGKVQEYLSVVCYLLCKKEEEIRKIYLYLFMPGGKNTQEG